MTAPPANAPSHVKDLNAPLDRTARLPAIRYASRALHSVPRGPSANPIWPTPIPAKWARPSRTQSAARWCIASRRSHARHAAFRQPPSLNRRRRQCPSRVAPWATASCARRSTSALSCIASPRVSAARCPPNQLQLLAKISRRLVNRPVSKLFPSFYYFS